MRKKHESIIRLYEVAGTKVHKDIANDLNVAPAVITNWANVSRGVSSDGAIQAAKFYGGNAIYITDGIGSPFPNENSQKQADEFVAGLKGAITQADAETEGRKSTHVPLYDVKFCCGDGVGAFEFEELKKTLPFDKTFFDRRGVKPDDVKLLYATGDSMSPWVQDGDAVAIDTSDTLPKDGEPYALFLDGDRMIKRIYREAGNTLILSSDNKAYRDKTVTEENGDSLIIIGRVFYRSG